jgi:hypothetical protein
LVSVMQIVTFLHKNLSKSYAQRFRAWRCRGNQGMSAQLCTKDKLKYNI